MFVCLFVCLCSCLFVCLCSCLFVCLFVCVFVYRGHLISTVFIFSVLFLVVHISAAAAVKLETKKRRKETTFPEK